MSTLALVFLVLFIMLLAYAVWKRNILAAVVALIALALALGVFR